MKCQLVSTLEAGRRTRGAYAYPVIWTRAFARYARWYMSLARQAVVTKPPREPGNVLPTDGHAEKRRLEAGDWVRVKSRTEIEALQQDADIADVVTFIPAPMSRFCGRTLRVAKVLDHYYDEIREGLCQAENAVLLEGATCDSSQLGNRRCGRACLHFWKESWLERVPRPEPDRVPEPGITGVRQAGVTEQEVADREGWNPGFRPGAIVRVLDQSRINETLDQHGVHEGVPFVPEHMAGCCGRIFVIADTVAAFFDEKADYMIRLPTAYMLAGVRCDGRQTEGEAHCDRGCALLWHAAWLEYAGRASVSGPGERQEGV